MNLRNLLGTRLADCIKLKFLLLIFILLTPGFEAFFDEEKKPSFYMAAVGEAVIFNCHIEFPHDVPIPYILNWNREGETIFSSYESNVSAKGSYKGRIKLIQSNPEYGKGSINLTNIRETDGGWYECQILYPNRSPITHQNGTWFHLKVEGGNVIATPPINQTTMEGEPARFPCLTKENSSTVIWKKDGIRISNKNHNFTEKYKFDANNTLIIPHTMMDDLGEFTCEATNYKGEKQSASAFLNVQYKAKVIKAPKEIYLPFGRTAIIDCHFRSNPPLLKLRWEKDGFLFDPYNVKGVYYKNNGSLFFEEVKEGHGGSYTCTPYNELGTEGPSPIMNAFVLKSPVFTVTPRMLYIRRRGETIHIPCEAIEEHGVHKPNIHWIKDGKILPNKGNLTLVDLKEEDRGIYKCIASNAVTSIFTETELMIENTAPRAPYDIEVKSSENSITVKWKSGLTKPKLEFSVWHRMVDSMTWKFLPVLPADARELTIPDLLSGTDYEIMVLSKDVYGEGMFSKSIKIKTKGETDYLGFQHHFEKNIKYDLSSSKSIGSPKNINVQITNDGCLITWDPPDEGLDDLEYYEIRWVENEAVVSAVTTDPFYLVKDSNKGQIYRFQVFAVKKNKDRSEGSVFVIYFPSDQRVKAVTLGISLGFVILVTTILLSWFIHKHFGHKT